MTRSGGLRPFSLFILLLAGLGSTMWSDARADGHSPELVAVYFRADWCSNCRILDPVYQEAQSVIADTGPRVEMFSLDSTASAEAFDAAMFAMLDRRMADIYKGYVGVTGIVFIAAADSGELLDCITRRDSVSTMVARFERASEQISQTEPGHRASPIGMACPPMIRALPPRPG